MSGSVRSYPRLKAISCTLYLLPSLHQNPMQRSRHLSAATLLLSSSAIIAIHPSSNYSLFALSEVASMCIFLLFSTVLELVSDVMHFSGVVPSPSRCNCLQFRPIAQLQLSPLPPTATGSQQWKMNTAACKCIHPKSS